MTSVFSRTLLAFPPVEGERFPFNGADFTRTVEDRFGIPVPGILSSFWNEFGWGYFSQRELFLFGGSHESIARESLSAWNDLTGGMYPPPSKGGPLFFAETCFGGQIGFRWDGTRAIGHLLDIDTFEGFRSPGDLEEMLTGGMADRDCFVDRQLLERLRMHLGPIRPGEHYAPIVSPLVGGSSDPGNYRREPARIHLATSLATWKALGKAGPQESP